MNNYDEYESISKNDYRNLPEYSKFRVKKENPPSTSYGKNYHLFRAKPAEQLSLEHTVYNKKMAKAGKLILAALAFTVLGHFAPGILAQQGITPEIMEYVKDAFVFGSSGFAIGGAMKFVGTINGPITMNDVEKYKEDIKENWEKEKNSYANRAHHGKRR